jgi:LSD1 subclass zinc finger protein
MGIEFPCAGCSRLLHASLEKEGQQIRCPHCDTVTLAPVASSELLHVEELEENVQIAEESIQIAEKERSSFAVQQTQIQQAIEVIDRGRGSHRGRRSDAALVEDGPCSNCRKPMKAGVMVLTSAVLLLEQGGVVLFLLPMAGSTPLLVAPFVLVAALSALALVGWFTVLHLSRDREGILWLRVRRHLCFIPYAYEALAIEDFDVVVIGHREGVDLRTGATTLILALPFLILAPFLLILVPILPSLVFRVLFFGWDGVLWLFARDYRGRNLDTYWVTLRDIRHREVRVYYGGNERLMRDIAETLADAGDLEIVR